MVGKSDRLLRKGRIYTNRNRLRQGPTKRRHAARGYRFPWHISADEMPHAFKQTKQTKMYGASNLIQFIPNFPACFTRIRRKRAHDVWYACQNERPPRNPAKASRPVAKWADKPAIGAQRVIRPILLSMCNLGIPFGFFDTIL